MTSTRHSDLMREADNVRLASTGRTTGRLDTVLRTATHLRTRLAGASFRSSQPVIAPHHS